MQARCSLWLSTRVADALVRTTCAMLPSLPPSPLCEMRHETLRGMMRGMRAYGELMSVVCVMMRDVGARRCTFHFGIALGVDRACCRAADSALGCWHFRGSGLHVHVYTHVDSSEARATARQLLTPPLPVLFPISTREGAPLPDGAALPEIAP